MAKQRRPPGFSEEGAGYQPVSRLPEPTTLADGSVRYFLTVGPKGRVLLPVELRSAMGLSEGDIVVGWLKDGELRLESQDHALKKIQKGLRRRVGDKSLVDELIAERRKAAGRGD